MPHAPGDLPFKMSIDTLRQRVGDCLEAHGRARALAAAVESQQAAVALLALNGVRNADIARVIDRARGHVASIKAAMMRRANAAPRTRGGTGTPSPVVPRTRELSGKEAAR